MAVRRAGWSEPRSAGEHRVAPWTRRPLHHPQGDRCGWRIHRRGRIAIPNIMLTRRQFALGLPALACLRSGTGRAEPPDVYVCPMHPEVRKSVPGKCPLCGMTLISKILEPVEYPVEFTFIPPAIPAGKPLTIDIRAFDPVTGAQVQNYEIIHEKPIHFFILSSDWNTSCTSTQSWSRAACSGITPRSPSPASTKCLPTFTR